MDGETKEMKRERKRKRLRAVLFVLSTNRLDAGNESNIWETLK